MTKDFFPITFPFIGGFLLVLAVGVAGARFVTYSRQQKRDNS